MMLGYLNERITFLSIYSMATSLGAHILCNAIQYNSLAATHMKIMLQFLTHKHTLFVWIIDIAVVGGVVPVGMVFKMGF